MRPSWRFMRNVRALATSTHSLTRTRPRLTARNAASMPAFIPPMNATLVAVPFDDPEWLFEVKWDGFRVETVVDRRVVRTLTRGGLDAGRYFGSFLQPPTWIAAKQA